MNNSSIGRLDRVDLRTTWANEASDFTPWLSQPENLALLGETIELDLQLEGTERWVGPYRADILCTDTLTNSWVLIENQLERTNHNHLGQLLTYAAGLNAVTIVWIARTFTDEHRAALDWLNNITPNDINFFGLEVELWRIGASPVAPKFNIISKPNHWTKTITTSREQSETPRTEVAALQLEFWQAFASYLEKSGSLIRPRTPGPRHFLTFAIGRTGFYLEACVYFVLGSSVSVQLMLRGRHASAYYAQLCEQRSAIETEIGQPLTWQERGERTHSIGITNSELDPNQRELWPVQFEWLKTHLELVYRTFEPRIRNLSLAEIDPGMP
jgi:hypothetical protein